MIVFFDVVDALAGIGATYSMLHYVDIVINARRCETEPLKESLATDHANVTIIIV